MAEFSDRVALVTGAGSGIGAACAEALAARGATVWCTDLEADAVERTAHAITAAGGRATPLVLDVTHEADWAQAVGSAGPLDMLVHAAGISAGSPVTETSLAEWRRVMAVNLDAAFLAMKHGVPALRERNGSLTVIASASGIKAAAGAAAYSSSKAAVRMLVRVVAKECRAAGNHVRVNSISPAGVRTPMWSAQPFFRAMVEELGSEDAAYAALEAQAGGTRFATPAQVAQAACYLASDAAALVTGSDLLLDDGYTI